MFFAAYQVVVKLPKGAVHMKVEELATSRNYLGEMSSIILRTSQLRTLLRGVGGVGKWSAVYRANAGLALENVVRGGSGHEHFQ